MSNSAVFLPISSTCYVKNSARVSLSNIVVQIWIYISFTFGDLNYLEKIFDKIYLNGGWISISNNVMSISVKRHLYKIFLINFYLYEWDGVTRKYNNDAFIYSIYLIFIYIYFCSNNFHKTLIIPFVIKITKNN